MNVMRSNIKCWRCRLTAELVSSCVRQILLGFIFVNCFSWDLLNISLLVCVGVAEKLHQCTTVVLIAVIEQWFRLCMKRFYRPWNDSRGSTVYSDVDDQGPSYWVGLSLVHYPVFSGVYFKCSRIHRYTDIDAPIIGFFCSRTGA
jgi:hypothetical protein